MVERFRFRLDRCYHEPGTAPGTLICRYSGPAREPVITFIRYSEHEYTERKVKSLEECWQEEAEGYVTWINIEGHPDPRTLAQLGQHYRLHPLALEDVLNVGQRPKWDSYGEFDFIIMYLLSRGVSPGARQVSIFMGGRFIITLEEAEEDAFEPVRERLRKDNGLIRKMGAGYLGYSICDTLVDGFFPLLERLGEQLDDLEDRILNRPERRLAAQIHDLKRDLFLLRRVAWDEREVINALQREDSPLVDPETRIYLRDCYDHTVQIIDIIETYRDTVSGILDTYLSSISNQMNAIMKTLTIIATIFIPLTFLVGVYGMNFNTKAGPLNMPELNWQYGYVALWALMLCIAGGMLLAFRRKGWF